MTDHTKLPLRDAVTVKPRTRGADWVSRLQSQYGSLQAARLRSDDKVVNASLQWLNIIAQEHWHEIIAALAQESAAAGKPDCMQPLSYFDGTDVPDAAPTPETDRRCREGGG